MTAFNDKDAQDGDGFTPFAENDPEDSDGEVAFWGKLILTAFPFLLVLLFLLLEWWVRGRS